MPYAYGLGRSTLRVIVRTPAGAVSGGRVAYNDRYEWGGLDWAPLAHTAELGLYAHDGEADYWAADLEMLPPRPRYRFGLETADGTRWLGFDGLADMPRPTGAFEFPYLAEGDQPDPPDWAVGATFYQIFPDRFARSRQAHRHGPVDPWDATPKPESFLGGDLDGIVERLDHIASLGVDALYLTPIFASPSNHKYDTTDYFAVDADFGGNPALRRLVDAVHARGMRLLLDGVFNHSGDQWPPFIDALERGAASPYADWFYFTPQGYETFAIDIPVMPKLRTSTPAVRDLVLRIGRFWVQEYGIDGWRLDVAHEVDHALWRRFRSAVREVSADALFVGETWDWALPWLRGDQFDSFMNYPLRRAMLAYASGGDAADFLDAIDFQRATYPEPTQHMLFNLLASHDVERPRSVAGGDAATAALAAGLLFFLPGIAAIYYGDEVGMTGAKEPANRGGMVWDEAAQDKPMLGLYRQLGAVRRRLPALRRGAYQRLDGAGSMAAFARGSGSERLVVVANTAAGAESLSAGRLAEWLDGRGRLVGTFSHSDADGSLSAAGLSVPPRSAVIVGRTDSKEN
jgi:cyclomaltodextrinase / maltogenic alpha-amylase / neopullulanase